jgi:hypothetical protein
MISEASDRAKLAAGEAVIGCGLPRVAAGETEADRLVVHSGLTAGAALAAAHDPKLGLDRSVCLRDVVALLRNAGGIQAVYDNHNASADLLESLVASDHEAEPTGRAA